VGGGGNGTICGGLGVDSLVGGLGGDTFVFQSCEVSATFADRIGDFKRGIDTISLSHNVFCGLEVGSLRGDRFLQNASGLADDLADRIIYDFDDGSLWFDQDGSGSRFQPLVFAVVEVGLHLVAQDFTIY
jgi:Ca2+-binding RTX toxin-like protein